MCLDSPAVGSLFPPKTSFIISSHPSLFPSLFPPPLSFFSTSFLLYFLLILTSPPLSVSSPRVHDPVGLHRACPAPGVALHAARPPQTAGVHQGASLRGEEAPVRCVKRVQRGRNPPGQSGGPLPGQRSQWREMLTRLRLCYLFTCCL